MGFLPLPDYWPNLGLLCFSLVCTPVRRCRLQRPIDPQSGPVSLLFQILGESFSRQILHRKARSKQDVHHHRRSCDCQLFLLYGSYSSTYGREQRRCSPYNSFHHRQQPSYLHPNIWRVLDFDDVLQGQQNKGFNILDCRIDSRSHLRL